MKANDRDSLAKTHRDENFPVASMLLTPCNRQVVLAFYKFARAADDIADAPALGAAEKIALLDRMRADLLGERGSGQTPVADALRVALEKRRVSPRHALDLLRAFRLDAVKRRYASWHDLMSYCSYSAMPVGRFMLELHGEREALWPASDAVCAALQIINHLQDCGSDYRRLDRVYIPLDALEEEGERVEALGGASSSDALLRCIRTLAGRARQLLNDGAALADNVSDWRLGLELAAVHALALRITRLLDEHDPLVGGVHLGRWEAGTVAASAVLMSLPLLLVRRGWQLIPGARKWRH